MLAQRAFTSPGALTRLLAIPGIGTTIRNTVVLAVACVIVAVVIGTFLAWCAASLGESRLGRVAGVLGTIPIMVPGIAAVTGWQFLLSPTVGYVNQALRATFPFLGDEGPFNVYSLYAIIMITALYLVSFVFTFVRTALRDVDGGSEDAARVAGSSWLGAQFRIVLPAIRPAVTYSIVIVALLALGQFTAPLLLGQTVGISVVTTEIYRLTGDFPADYGAAAMLSIPVLVLASAVLVAQRRVVGSLDRYSTVSKGRSRGRAVRRWPFIPIALFAIFIIIPPILGLTFVAFSPFWSGKFSLDGLTFRNFEAVFSNPLVFGSIVTTLQLAVVGVIACLVVSVLLALYLHRAKGKLAAALDFTINLPLTVPAIVIGVAIYFAYAIGPINIYGTQALIVIAWVVMFLPHSVRLILAGLTQMGGQVREAAQVAGSTAAGATIRVVLPLLRRSLTSGALLVFIMMVHEFAAVVLLATRGTQVLSTQLYQYYNTGTFGQMAVLGLIMVCISMIGMLIIQLAGGKAKWML
jgi:iron(III) transport system permease protein